MYCEIYINIAKNIVRGFSGRETKRESTSPSSMANTFLGIPRVLFALDNSVSSSKLPSIVVLLVSSTA